MNTETKSDMMYEPDNLTKYGHEYQLKCITGLISDKSFMERINDIVEPKCFETDANQWIVKTALDYFLRYKELPTMEVYAKEINTIEIEALKVDVAKDIRLVFNKITDTDLKYIKEQFIEFCKNQALKRAILQSVTHLNNAEYEKIKTVIDHAMKAGIERNIGHDYMVDIEKRMSIMARATVSTRWQVIDQLMDGGLAAGELGVVTACAGAGKSWVLSKIGAEAMRQGKNVLHVTLELNENYVGLRYDACFTGIDFQSIRNNIGFVKERLSKIPGKLIIKYFPIKSISAHHIKMHVERLALLGTHIDLLVVDYADILRPFQSDKNSNSYSEAGGIYEELRGVAGELQIPIWTASQSNRAGMEEDVLTAMNISDSYRKIMTADFVMSLSRKTQDKTSNTARVHIIKNRFGPDGLTFPARMNAGCGDIQLFDEGSREGAALINEMNQSENIVKKMMSSKWKEHMGRDNDES